MRTGLALLAMVAAALTAKAQPATQPAIDARALVQRAFERIAQAETGIVRYTAEMRSVPTQPTLDPNILGIVQRGDAVVHFRRPAEFASEHQMGTCFLGNSVKSWWWSRRDEGRGIAELEPLTFNMAVYRGTSNTAANWLIRDDAWPGYFAYADKIEQVGWGVVHHPDSVRRVKCAKVILSLYDGGSWELWIEPKEATIELIRCTETIGMGFQKVDAEDETEVAQVMRTSEVIVKSMELDAQLPETALSLPNLPIRPDPNGGAFQSPDPVGQTIPDVLGITADGRRLTAADLRGQTFVVWNVSQMVLHSERLAVIFKHAMRVARENAPNPASVLLYIGENPTPDAQAVIKWPEAAGCTIIVKASGDTVERLLPRPFVIVDGEGTIRWAANVSNAIAIASMQGELRQASRP